MIRIAVVTDSAVCLPADMLKAHRIEVVSFRVIFGERVFRDGVDLTPQAFYRLQQESPHLPTTSQPSIGELLDTYRRLLPEVEGIVSIHVASEMSGTCNAALRAKDLLPGAPIRVIDSRTAAMAQGFVVLAAARAALAGGDMAQVVAAAEAMIPQVHLFATLESLDYLARSGRVNNLAALVASALRVRPVFELQAGRVNLLARARGREAAIESMLETMKARVGHRPVHVGIFHAAVPDQAAALKQKLSRLDCREILVAEFTPVMGAHTGPGVLGLAFYAEEE